MLQAFPVGCTEQPGHLHQPGRRLLAQQGHETLALRGTAEVPQRLQHRQVGFPGAVVLDTLAMRYPQRRLGHGLHHKCLHDCRFTNARLSRDKDDLPCPLLRLRQTGMELVQHCFPLDEQWRGRKGESGRESRRGSSGRCGGRQGHRGEEAIAPPGHSGNEARRLPGIVQRLAQRANGHAHNRIAHGSLRPDSIQQLVFGHQTVRVRHQVGQHVERFGRQGHGLDATPQARVG